MHVSAKNALTQTALLCCIASRSAAKLQIVYTTHIIIIFQQVSELYHRSVKCPCNYNTIRWWCVQIVIVLNIGRLALSGISKTHCYRHSRVSWFLHFFTILGNSTYRFMYFNNFIIYCEIVFHYRIPIIVIHCKTQ